MQMMRAKCKKCGWDWDVVTSPMPVTEWCEAMKSACCPMCCNKTGNTLSPPRPLDERETAHKKQQIEKEKDHPCNPSA